MKRRITAIHLRAAKKYILSTFVVSLAWACLQVQIIVIHLHYVYRLPQGGVINMSFTLRLVLGGGEAGDVLWLRQAETNPSLHFLFKTNYSGLAGSAHFLF